MKEEKEERGGEGGGEGRGGREKVKSNSIKYSSMLPSTVIEQETECTTFLSVYHTWP